MTKYYPQKNVGHPHKHGYPNKPVDPKPFNPDPTPHDPTGEPSDTPLP